MLRLEAWRAGLAADGLRVPHLDPLDGGDRARLLLLLETPGPGAEDIRFVSRDNPTGTARNLRLFLDEAGIARADTIIWNAVPWIVHAPGARNRPLRRSEVVRGIAMLPPFLALLPHLSVVVLAGRIAAGAADAIGAARPSVPLIAMPHPSPTYVCTSPEVPARIRAALRAAAAVLEG